MGIKGEDHDQSQSAGAYGPRKMGIVAKDICVGMVQRGHRDRTARELGQWGSGGKQSDIPGLYFFVKAVKLRG